MMTYQVHELLLLDGSSPYAKWFMRLDPQAAAKVTVAKLRLQQGNLSNVKWLRGIGEYRIDWGPGYRLYLAREDEHLILLLGGGTKKGQQADINKALELWAEYKSRKAAQKIRG
ncbi:MAG: type II toxin-antitoxin system RelE/ParE family toxin [Nitrosomonadaceae bacterium]|nr:type II toxin-antitoxin system RelE/ParE family toxin [Nitrosomonadaceae bacterium]